MNLHNTFLSRQAVSIRYGLATNSSSSHSICLLPPEEAEAVQENLVDVGSGRYGWSWFTLKSKEAKLDYLYTNLYQQVSRILRPNVREWSLDQPYMPNRPSVVNEVWLNSFVKEALECNFSGADRYAKNTTLGLESGDSTDSWEPNLDHDSCFSYPLHSGTKLPHVGYIRWFRDQVLSENVVIWGGNDNSDEGGVGFGGGENIRLPDDEYMAPYFAFDRDDHWLLFREAKDSEWNRIPSKLRVPKNRGDLIDHSSLPELVDLKITDYCDAGCAYCYQGSTKSGKHTKLSPNEIASLLSTLGVREVALGGGEPLLYPEIELLLQRIRQVEIIPNVTTRRLDLAFPLMAYFGAVGYSIDSYKRLVAALDPLVGKSRPEFVRKITVHIVLGSMPLEEMEECMNFCKKYRLNMLLLGYKTDGRGAKFKPYPVEGWVDRLATLFGDSGYWGGPFLGVDTAIVDTYGSDLLTKLKVDPRLMVSGEGLFSLYIDAVDLSFGKASYGHPQMIPLPHTKSNGDITPKAAELIINSFRQWHEGIERLALAAKRLT